MNELNKAKRIEFFSPFMDEKWINRISHVPIFVALLLYIDIYLNLGRYIFTIHLKKESLHDSLFMFNFVSASYLMKVLYKNPFHA